MNRKIIDLWVGIFVAIGLAALVFLALKVGNLLTTSEERTGYQVEARFDNIGNLKPRAPVKSAGVVVGRGPIDPPRRQDVRGVARLHIYSHYQFPRDTIAAIFTSGLLGEQFVGLEAGGDTVMLKDEERIRKTQSAVQRETDFSSCSAKLRTHRLPVLPRPRHLLPPLRATAAVPQSKP